MSLEVDDHVVTLDCNCCKVAHLVSLVCGILCIRCQVHLIWSEDNVFTNDIKSGFLDLVSPSVKVFLIQKLHISPMVVFPVQSVQGLLQAVAGFSAHRRVILIFRSRSIGTVVQVCKLRQNKISSYCRVKPIWSTMRESRFQQRLRANT